MQRQPRRWAIAITVAVATSIAGSGTGTAQTSNIGIVFADGFESGDLGAWDEVDTTRYSVTSAPTRVRSGSYALEGEISGDGYGEINKWFLPGYDQIYVKFYTMFEEGFLNQRQDGSGMHFVFIAGNRIDDRWSAHGQAGIVPDGTDFFATSVDPEQSPGNSALGPLEFYTYYPDMRCCYGNTFEQAAPKAPLVPGQWQEVIVHVDAGTPGQADGSQSMWINGELKVEVSGIRWRNSSNLLLNELAFVNYMPGPLRTQHIWIDDVVVSTEFPGSAYAGSGPFADVSGSHAFAAEISWLAAQGITRGCNSTGTLFCPADPVGRGEMAAFLVRALSLPAATRDWFADDGQSMFEADINAVAEAGITVGCGPGAYCPVGLVSREQMASFLVRALAIPPSSTDRFGDDEASVHEADINSLAEAGITLGCGPTSFCPSGLVTRSQMAAFLYRGLGAG